MFYCNTMIDCHVHTKYSKHAYGEMEEVVLSAIKKGCKIITITDHAPFIIDRYNRILISELEKYLNKISILQNKYKNDILILKGLECDFIPRSKYINFINNILKNIEIDYAIGSIHYVFVKNRRYNIWDIHELNNQGFIDEYFAYLKELINLELFDSIGHPDSILRAGVSEELFIGYIKTLTKDIIKSGIAWEINTSGIFKSSLPDKNGITKCFPSIRNIKILSNNDIKFTIGSDAHNPADVLMGYEHVISRLDRKEFGKIVYFKERKPWSVVK